MVDERIKADIIDNTRDGITMQKILKSEIPYASQIDISTGYFDVDGYGLLRDVLEKSVKDQSFRMRLLLGKEAILSNEGSFEEYAQQYKDAHDAELPLKSSLEENQFVSDTRVNTVSLINFLEKSTVQVRLGSSRFNHSKCYILGDNSVFIGSSNFTQGGLTRNYELNAGLYQPGVTKQTRHWFNEMWKQAKDTKKDLINVLKQSKFGTPATPFEIYMKMLFERYLPQIGDLKDDDNIITQDLAQFQKEAVSRALKIIHDYNGVMIADSTGLGKTNMGIAILRHKISNERKRAILVAPKQVKDSMWVEKLRDADIAIRHVITHSEIALYDAEDFAKFRNIDFVLVDESQGFRSNTAKRRDNLMRLLDTGKKKEIVLMSATPINNSLMDLYYQLLLITGDEPGYFSEAIGISNLYKHMRNASNNKNKQAGLEKIQQLVDTIMIRRGRTQIREQYPNDTINGKKISFPKHEYEPIQYDLSEMYPNIFKVLAEDSTRLTMAPYGIEYYNTKLTEQERKKSRVTAHLQKIMLLKRFESSIAAVKISLANKIRMYKYVLKIVETNQNKILRVSEFNKIMTKWNTMDNNENLDDKHEADDQEEYLLNEIEKIELMDGQDYALDDFKIDMKNDLKMLQNMSEMINDVRRDTKLEALHEKIMTDRALKSDNGKSGKVLIFTEYAATARYLLEKLGGTMKGRGNRAKRDNNGNLIRNDTGLLSSKIEIEIMSGNTSPKNRLKRIKAFAPVANSVEDESFEGKEIDVLISTEILAEGQNLQDCNYVINYDLPWNPMRIVQRTGRIDRLTSKYSTIYSRACYPDKDLEKLLNLMAKLTSKIRTVDDTIGDDGSILGITMTPRATMINELGRLGNHTKTISVLEHDQELLPENSLMEMINKYVKKIGINEMMAVPMGRRSGKKGDSQKVILAYLQKQPHRYVHFVIYDYKTRQATVSDETEAMKLIKSDPDENVHLPMDSDYSNRSFEELLNIDRVARGAIRTKINHILEEKLRGDDEVGRRREKLQNELERELTNAFNDGHISEDDANRILKMMEKPQMLRRDKEINILLAEYKIKHEPNILVDGIANIAKYLFLNDRVEKLDNTKKEFDELGFVLIGAMFITGNKFNDDIVGI